MGAQHQPRQAMPGPCLSATAPWAEGPPEQECYHGTAAHCTSRSMLGFSSFGLPCLQIEHHGLSRPFHRIRHVNAQYVYVCTQTDRRRVLVGEDSARMTCMVRVPGRHIAGKTDSKEASSLVGEAYIYRCTYHNHHFLIVIKPTAVCKASMCMYACMHGWMY